ncbi:MAG TPA: hypothetical protein VFW25_03120 [Silvibacterium sp.]|nr:hypothetical protein [Silvibacterium sp.]
MNRERNPDYGDAAEGEKRVRPDGQSLRLTALSADQPERLVRFLTGAILVCGGWILTRSTQGDQSAELDFQFPRASCVEIYAVLVASGLELSRDSHLQLAGLCQCTRNLLSQVYDITRIELTVRHASSMPSHDDYAVPLAA